MEWSNSSCRGVVALIAALFAGVPRTPEAQALVAPAGYGFGVGAAMTTDWQPKLSSMVPAS